MALEAAMQAKEGERADQKTFDERRLPDPTTGQIPTGMRQRELNFAKKLPHRMRGPGQTDKAFTGWEVRGPGNIGAKTIAYVKGLGPMSCAVSLFEYSDTSCNNWLTGSGAPIFNSSGDWVLVDNRHTTSPTTQGARLHFYCQNPSSFLGLLDDAFMVPGDVIFADGFESGSTAAWDSTT